MIGGWLHLVAHRIAMRVRCRRARSRVTETLSDDLPAKPLADDSSRRDIWLILEEEIGRLKEKFRVVCRLCYLEGLTSVEAAKRLACRPGTVRSLLSRCREQLIAALVRRGVVEDGSNSCIYSYSGTKTTSKNVLSFDCGSGVGDSIPATSTRVISSLICPPPARPLSPRNSTHAAPHDPLAIPSTGSLPAPYVDVAHTAVARRPERCRRDSGPAKKSPSKPDARILLETLEDRCTPQDMMGVLKSGVSVAGFTIMSGQFITPMHALFQGWDDGLTKVNPPTDASGSAVIPPLPDAAEPRPGKWRHWLPLPRRIPLTRVVRPVRFPCSRKRRPQPAAQAARSDYELGDWLQTVGDFLGGPPAPVAMPASTDSAGTNNGGGGGGSNGPSSTMSTPPPAAPMSTNAANVPNANTAAQMIQPVAAPAPTLAAAPSRNGSGNRVRPSKCPAAALLRRSSPPLLPSKHPRHKARWRIHHCKPITNRRRCPTR